MNLALSASKKILSDVILGVFKKVSTLTSIEWAKEHVRIGIESSTIETGRFNALLFPALEYVYDCLDNPKIPVIFCIKSARFGWTTLTIVWLAKTIVEAPRNILFCFGTRDSAHKFYKDQWLPFINGIPSLLKVMNVGLSLTKIAWNHTPFYGGYLRFVSTNVLGNLLSSNIPIVLFEEPDSHKTEAEGFGNILFLVMERMKLVPLPLRKLLIGGTSSFEGSSFIYQIIKSTNDLVFKAECHHCKSLVSMDYTFFEHFQWEVWPDGKEHIEWGKYNPATVRWYCPFCEGEWTDADKNANILAGKQYGFTDHTGKFSKGWHPNNPHITENFGFRGSECLSPLNGVGSMILNVSSFVEMSKKILAAEYSANKGDESKLAAVWNNMFGWAYRTRKHSLTIDSLKDYYSTFSAGIAPNNAFIPYLGIDVQRNRLAFTVVVAGRKSCFWVLDWFEFFGEVDSFSSDLWAEAFEFVKRGVPHVNGQRLNFQGVAIDCQDGITAEYVYAWVASLVSAGYPAYAVRGVNELKASSDPIFSLPSQVINASQTAKEKTLADTYGVIPYKMGTHACQTRVMSYLENGTKKGLDGKPQDSEVLYFTHYERSDFLEQMTSCVLVPNVKGKTRGYRWDLVSGKRMEALACVKMCFWLAAKDGVFGYTDADWMSVEQVLA